MRVSEIPHRLSLTARMFYSLLLESQIQICVLFSMAVKSRARSFLLPPQVRHSQIRPYLAAWNNINKIHHTFKPTADPAGLSLSQTRALISHVSD